MEIRTSKAFSPLFVNVSLNLIGSEAVCSETTRIDPPPVKSFPLLQKQGNDY